MSYTSRITAREGALATVTLNRPPRGNALYAEMWRELMDVVPRIEVDPTVRAVLLTAQGKLSCAGGDLVVRPG